MSGIIDEEELESCFPCAWDTEDCTIMEDWKGLDRLRGNDDGRKREDTRTENSGYN